MTVRFQAFEDGLNEARMQGRGAALNLGAEDFDVNAGVQPAQA